jgi:tetratricopeptide (TPR) repeat protein
VKLLLFIRKRFIALPRNTQWIQPAAGGLVVGVMGWFVLEVLGVGYGHVSEALNGQMALRVMALLVALKLVATAACYGTGNAGGIFGPSLFIGAMMGGAVGSLAHQLVPDYTGSVGAYALVGMGAAFAGIVRVPLTSVIMIFEMTRDYTIIVPLMISNLISYYISCHLQKEPIYEALQHQDGLHLPRGARDRQESLAVRDAVTAPPHLFSKDDLYQNALTMLSSERNAWPVCDGQRLLGMVSLAEVETEIKNGHGAARLEEIPAAQLPGELITAENFPHVHLDHPLAVALQRMAGSKMSVLPVVSRSDIRDLKGVVTLNSILQAYGIGGERVTSPSTTVEVGVPRRIVPSVIAAALALLILIGFLNYYYRSARGARAESSYKNAMALAQQDRDAEAVEQFRNSLSVSPGNARYRLALGLELAKMGRGEEGVVYLREVLRSDPTNPQASLGLARIATAENHTLDAITYYHRAIDATWPSGQEQERIQARFELVSYLAKQGMKTQAIAELLATLEQARDNATKNRIGRLLLQYGAVRQAADLFREIAQSSQADAEAWSGLGTAELAQEDYAAARNAFRNALRADPSDSISRKRLGISERVITLDPEARGIRSSERYRRSKALLQGVLEMIEQCAGGGADSQLAAEARKALAEHPRAAQIDDATEENLALAVQLWKERRQACPAYTPSDEAMERILARLSSG